MKDVIEFNNSCPSDFNMYVVNRPDIPSPEWDIEEIEVPGRDGTLTLDKKRYKNIEIPIEFNYIGKEEEWAQKWREAKKWLSARNALLFFDDDIHHFYFVKCVQLSANNRKTNRIGYFTATFVCMPYCYLISGKVEKKQDMEPTYLCMVDGTRILTTSGENILSQTLYTEIINPYEECTPLYRIVGNGTYNISVNGRAMKFSVDGELIIDTEREIAYSKNKRMNAYLSGYYNDLRFAEGKNIIESSGDFELYITPNWREL